MRSNVLLALLAAVALAQSPMELQTPAVKRVGEKLACKCGSCNNTVGNCAMLECHYSHPARQRIHKMQQEGASDEAIIATFVKEGGLAALAAPPAEGFSLLSWVMPFVAILAGLGVIWVYINRFRKPVVAVPPPADPRYRERIERDLSELD